MYTVAEHGDLTANMIRDKVKRLESDLAQYVRLRTEAASVKIYKEKVDDKLTDADVDDATPKERTFEFYHKLVTKTQVEMAELKKLLSVVNNTPRESKALGYDATVHDMLVSLAFATSEVSSMERISNAGLKPSIQKSANGYGKSGAEFTVYVYDEEFVREYLGKMKDLQSALRREIDYRNETLTVAECV